MAVLPSGFAHVVMSGAGSGMPNGWAWTFAIELPGSPDPPAAIALQIAQDLGASTLMSNFQASVVHQQVLVKFGPTATGPSAANNTAIAGTAGGAQAPPNTAVLVHKSTAFGGRAGRGRIYLPPVNETSITADGLIDTALVAAIQNDINDFFARLLARGYNDVLLHGETSPITTPSSVTATTVDGRIATQRRRLRR